MPDTTYGFNATTVKRIAETVKDHERSKPDLTGSDTPPIRPQDNSFWAVTVGDSWTDNRYAVARILVSNTDTTSTSLVTMSAGTADYAQTCIATNLAESASGTHALVPGTWVKVFWEHDPGPGDVGHHTHTVRYMFSCEPPLAVGYYCVENSEATLKANDSHGIYKVSFNKDEFHLALDLTDASRMEVDWNGFTVVHKKYSAAADKVCHVKILDFVDIGSSGPSHMEPVGGAAIGGTSDTQVVNPVVPATISNDQYNVYFTIGDEYIADDCAVCTNPTAKKSTNISANIYIPTCQYLSNVTDCLSGIAMSGVHSWACVQNFKFGDGLIVTGTAGTGGSAGSVNVSLGLNVIAGVGVSYTSDSDFGGSGGCGHTLKICTRTITPTATTVMTGCDADGNPITTTIYTLPNGDPIIALMAC